MFAIATLLTALLASASATPVATPAATSPSGRLSVATTPQCNRSPSAARACEFCAQYVAALVTAPNPFTFGSPAVQRFCSALLTRGDVLVAGFDFTPVPGVTPGFPAGPGGPGGPGVPGPTPPTPV